MSLSRFLKIPDAAFTPALLHRQVFFYVIEEFHSQIENFSYQDGCDAEKLVQCLIDKSTHRFRMYGSAQELLENVKIFTNFPASSHVFKVDKAPYTTPPTIFYSMKNEKYICKSDLFVILQNMGYQDSDPRKLLLRIAVHLQSEEDKMGDRVEFWRFDEKVLEEIEKEIKLVMADKQLLAQQNEQMKIVEQSYPEMPLNSEEQHKIRRFFEKKQAGEVPPETIMAIEKLGLFQHAMDQVIQKRPEMFPPYSKNYSNHPITVRVFEDGDQRFVLKVDLSDALFLKGVISVPLSEDGAFHTMSMEQVLKKYDIENIEFIRYPIHRAKHRMVPVKIFNPPTAHFTVLAVDGLFELLREAICSLKVFQGSKSASDRLLETTAFLDSHQKSPYFLTIEGLNNLKNMWKEKLGNVTKIGVRKVKKDGFTLQRLKTELTHLGLVTTFPEIQKHADVVYSEVVKKKREEFLRTCDLLDALEHCQLNCIFENFDFLKTFLHNQKGCHRVYGYKCEKCDKIQKAPEVPTSTSESKNPESQVQKTSDGPKTSEFKKTSQASSKSQIQKTSSSEVTPPPKSNISTQKTSNNAEELKKIQKEKLDEKEAEIQRLKRIIEEKNEENQKLNGQISALKISISQLKTENSRQKEVQKLLEERNSKLEEELNKEKMKALEIQKSELESKILGENQKLDEFKDMEIRMKAEHEMNQKMIQQLLNKLGGGGANYSKPSTSSGWN